MQKLLLKTALQCHITVRSIKHCICRHQPGSDVDSILIGATTLLGDVMMTAPLIHAVKQCYPHATLTLLVRREFADLAKCIHDVDHVVEFHKKDPTALRQLFKHPALKADLGFIAFEPLLIPYFYAWDVKTIRSLPDPKGRYKRMINDVAALPTRVNYLSCLMIETLLKDNPVYEKSPFLTLPSNISLPDKLEQQHPYAILHVGASKPVRFWPSKRYAAVADYLVNQGINVVFTGAPNEVKLVEQVIAQMQDKRHAINLTGKTNLLQLATLIKQAHCVVAPDTGVIHLARALNTKTLCILGTSQIDVYGPDKKLFDLSRHLTLYRHHLDCRDTNKLFGYRIPGIMKCARHTCPFEDHPCMRQITEQDVIEQLQNLITVENHSS